MNRDMQEAWALFGTLQTGETTAVVSVVVKGAKINLQKLYVMPRILVLTPIDLHTKSTK